MIMLLWEKGMVEIRRSFTFYLLLEVFQFETGAKTKNKLELLWLNVIVFFP